jgi:hypothetical protein
MESLRRDVFVNPAPYLAESGAKSFPETISIPARLV